MAESPNKRQRLTSESYLSRNSNDNTVAQSTPTTPTRRRSYASPTKASLARSHPYLLSKSPRRAATEPRDKRAQYQASEGSPTSPIRDTAAGSQGTNRLQDNEIAGDGLATEPNDFVTAIAHAFRDAPARAQTPERKEYDPQNFERTVDRRPLSPRQPRGTTRATSITLGERQSSDLIMPKLVRRNEAAALDNPRDENDELDLPPTPVQLGLTQKPERPRGLASSSSGGSKDGSGKNRKRFRANESRAITSSPLKPRDTAEQLQRLNRLDADVSADEAPESEADEPQPDTHDTISEELRTKQSELVQLQSELQALKEDIAQLDNVVNQLQNQQSTEVGAHLFGLLEKSMSRHEYEEPPPSSAESGDAYLTLFAPANISLSYTTEVKNINRRPKIVHELTIALPSSWAPETLKMTLIVMIDAKDSRIESVRRQRSGPLLKQAVLQQWMDSRLQSPLHQRDIGGLIFGASQYMEACVARAHALHELHNTFGSDTPVLAGRTKTDYRLESSYLDMTQLVLRSPGVSAHGQPITKQLLVSYTLHLDWTGIVKSEVHISCSGVGPKAHKGAKDLFQKLVATEGILTAVSKIWSLLEFDTVSKTRTTNKDGRNQSKKERKKVVNS